MVRYNKRYYIVLAAMCGTIAYMVLGVSESIAPSTAAVLFFLANFEPSVVDLLCEGKYAELMIAKPYTGPDIVALVWYGHTPFTHNAPSLS